VNLGPWHHLIPHRRYVVDCALAHLQCHLCGDCGFSVPKGPTGPSSPQPELSPMFLCFCSTSPHSVSPQTHPWLLLWHGMKHLKKVLENLLSGGSWKNLTNPSVDRGQTTAWPGSSTDQARLGVRLDYDGKATSFRMDHYKYNVQANTGPIPSPNRITDSAGIASVI
jgi:hypothetical protein